MRLFQHASIFLVTSGEENGVTRRIAKEESKKESEREQHDDDVDCGRGSERVGRRVGDDEFSDHKESHRKEVFVSGSETVSRDVYVNRGWRVSIADSGVSTVCEYHDEFSEREDIGGDGFRAKIRAGVGEGDCKTRCARS